jgi:hypothetical protein
MAEVIGYFVVILMSDARGGSSGGLGIRERERKREVVELKISRQLINSN